MVHQSHTQSRSGNLVVSQRPFKTKFLTDPEVKACALQRTIHGDLERGQAQTRKRSAFEPGGHDRLKETPPNRALRRRPNDRLEVIEKVHEVSGQRHQSSNDWQTALSTRDMLSRSKS